MRKRRRLRRLAWALGLALVAGGALTLTQPLWLFDVTARLVPDVVWRIETSQPLVALTFDDGPVPGQTSLVLDILARHDARATFFMIGERVQAYPDLVGRVRSQGHELGNHAYTGRRTVGLSQDDFIADLRRTERVLGLRGPTKVYRPPSGLILPSQLALVRKEGYHCVLGSAYPYDPMGPPAAYIRWLILRNLAPGVVVVLHDGIPEPANTLEALDAILEAGRRKGLRFVPVGELLAVARRSGRSGPVPSMAWHVKRRVAGRSTGAVVATEPRRLRRIAPTVDGREGGAE